MKMLKNKKSLTPLQRKAGFSARVLVATSTIPRGRVATYAQIARIVGSPRSYRAVGNALNKNPFAPRVPCHRVVASNGALGGYASGLKKKIALLTREGILIRRGKIDLELFGVHFAS